MGHRAQTGMMGDLDTRIRHYYTDLFDEDARLTTRSPQGPLEFDRTQALLASAISDGSRILDIGGGTGHHARALAERGCIVEMLDPVPAHVRTAASQGVRASVGDARSLDYPDDSFDAAILLGPLYHLDRAGRERALTEAVRVTRPGGVIAAVGLSRWVAFQRAATDGGPLTAQALDLLRSGQPISGQRFPAAHFHTADELAAELIRAGIGQVIVHGVEGPVGTLLESVSADAALAVAESARLIAELADEVPALRDQSVHLLAIGVVD